ncbi:speckle-type POZ protein-like [Trichogramma pretiosum]|uniref:speckle-type POZ protein-like n=1 Tax=Trichogramma pretiosum TaxID=7493 RepID=UPI0006C9E572|nr:speckle-type POZ protein-like [Trichogramma pretiosum]
MSSDNTYFTSIDKERYNFKWVISDYALMFTKVTGIESHIFTVGNDKKFQLKLSNNTFRDAQGYSKTTRCLSLHALEMAGQLIMKYKLSMIKDEKILDTKVGHSPCLKGMEIQILNVQIEEMKKFVSSTDTITFHFELTVSKGNITNSLNCENAKMNQDFKLKFDWIFLEEELSDVKLQTASKQEIPAHKVVLAAASKVFKGLIENNSIQLIDMKDVNYEVAVEMLYYIYTGRIEEHKISLTGMIDLLVAADKYKIEELKVECEKILSAKIASENAVDILKVADQCRMKRLKKNAVDFIKRHINASSDSEDVGNMILSMEKLFSK